MPLCRKKDHFPSGLRVYRRPQHIPNFPKWVYESLYRIAQRTLFFNIFSKKLCGNRREKSPIPVPERQRKMPLPAKKQKTAILFPKWLFLVPLTGLEPVRYRYRGILSPLCLPISPQRRTRLFYHNRSAPSRWVIPRFPPENRGIFPEIPPQYRHCAAPGHSAGQTSFPHAGLRCGFGHTPGRCRPGPSAAPL